MDGWTMKDGMGVDGMRMEELRLTVTDLPGHGGLRLVTTVVSGREWEGNMRLEVAGFTVPEG